MSKQKNKKPIHYFSTFSFGVLIGISLTLFPFEKELKHAEIITSNWPTKETKRELDLPLVAQVIHHKDFSLAYDARNKNAYWVYTKLTQEKLKTNLNRKECDFQEEISIPKHLRATNKDYRDSGFDRGHLYPAADASSQEAMEETFYLSNIVPQNPKLNRGYWKKLENHLRQLTETNNALHVFVGPLYTQTTKRKKLNYIKYQVIGSNNVAVPSHFFVVIFIEDKKNQTFLKTYILPNHEIDAEIALSKFSTTLEKVEQLSGVYFPFKAR